MVASGDMAVEMPFELVPLITKAALSFPQLRQPVISSLLKSSVLWSTVRYRRAEASDCANAVLGICRCDYDIE